MIRLSLSLPAIAGYISGLSCSPPVQVDTFNICEDRHISRMGWECHSQVSLGRFRQISQNKLNSAQQMASLSLSLFLKLIYSNDK